MTATGDASKVRKRLPLGRLPPGAYEIEPKWFYLAWAAGSRR